jgi:beta-mannosidase
MLFPYLEKEDLSDYKDEFKKFRARFIAEEPQMGAISFSSLRRFMDEKDIYETDDMWLYHTQSNPALKRELFEYLTMMTEKILGKFTDGRDRLFKMRYMQYEWIRVVMEQARREKGLCSGIIYWMMNECWPAASGWSLIDFYNLPKDGFYSFKRCARPVVASVDYDGKFYNALIVNDGKEREIKGRLSLISADGKTVTPGSLFSNVFAKDTAETLIVTGVRLEKGEMLVFDVESELGRDRAFYRPGALEIHPTEVEFILDKDGKTVTVSADRYVHAVTFSGNAIFEDNCFSLLPGESRTVSYRPLKEGLFEDISVEAYTV